MSCTRLTPCGGLLVEDRTFTVQAEREGLRVRLERCTGGGHSYYSGATVPLRGSVPRTPTGRCCDQCGDLMGPELGWRHRACRRT